MSSPSGWKLAAVAVLLAVASAAPAAGESPKSDAVVQFRRFCARHFTASAEEEVRRTFGAELKAEAQSLWTHVSETSACVSWQTNLPARTFVEYGPTTRYEHKTRPSDQLQYTHLHYLRGLKPGATVYCRLMAVDEKGKRVCCKAMTLAPRPMPQAVRIPGKLPGPPFVLDKPNTTYLLTEDVAGAQTGFFLAASGVTLDLGGHTVTYDAKRDTTSAGACGVRGHKSRGIGLTGVTVTNGLIRRGSGGSATRKVYDTLYTPVFFSKPSKLTLAGLTIRHHGCQVVGMVWLIRGSGNDVHHNVLTDAGTTLFNRHVGMDAITIRSTATRCRHNLIQRSRHRGVAVTSDNEVHGNEIYVDSHATNSYGVMYYTNRAGGRKLAIHHNRIFGTGYHPIGIGSGQGYSDVEIHGNYIQMQGTSPKDRWRGGQGGGDDPKQIHPVNGIRLQKCGNRVHHHDNVIVVKGRGRGCSMRGLWLVPGKTSGPDVTFRNNRVKLIAQDAHATGYAVSAGGVRGGRPAPILLTGNMVITNLGHVQFGDNYSHGGRYTFRGNTFGKVGSDRRYKTIRFGWRGWKYGSSGHAFIATRFEGGAGYDSVSFDGGRTEPYDFTVGWDLTVRAPPDARVVVKDRTGAAVFSADVSPSGRIVASLAEYRRTRKGKTRLTPHTLSVATAEGATTRKVAVRRNMTIEVKPLAAGGSP